MWHEITAAKIGLDAKESVTELAELLLQEEIALEFRDNPYALWGHIAHQMWLKYRMHLDGCRVTTARRLASMTPSERAQVAEVRRAHDDLLRATVVGIRHCIVCKAPFVMTAYAEKFFPKKRHCSRECISAGKGRKVTLDGRTKNISAWCRELGVARKTVRSRLARGFSPVEAFRVGGQRTDPRYKYKHKISPEALRTILADRARGMSLRAIAAKFGVDKSAIQFRLKRHAETTLKPRHP